MIDIKNNRSRAISQKYAKMFHDCLVLCVPLRFFAKLCDTILMNQIFS